jgi:hypothetical protein
MTLGVLLARRRLPERFLAKIDFAGPVMPGMNTPCWLWTAGKHPKGYGAVWFDGGMRLAHRIIYELLSSVIPANKQLDHLCLNHPCVNPAHLEVVTQRVNILRGNGLSARRARQSHCLRGHEFSTANTMVTRLGQRKCRTCDNERRRIKRAT